MSELSGADAFTSWAHTEEKEYTVNDLKKTWDAYASSWKAETPESKRTLFTEALAEDCTYTDPVTVREGWNELIEYMLEFHQQVPGGHFVTTRFWAHHGRSVAIWEMRDGSGNKLSDGVSHGQYNHNGQLVTMTGFFDLPS